MAKTWFLYTPNSREVHRFSNNEELEKQAQDIMRDVYLDNEWSEEVFHCVAGYAFIPEDAPTGLEHEWFEKFQTHEVIEVRTDEPANYSGEEGDEWPYNDDWAWIGFYDLEEIKK